LEGRDGLYFMVLAYRMNGGWWSSDGGTRDEILGGLRARLDGERSRLLLMRSYKSLRWDSDLIFWLASRDPEALGDFKLAVNSALRGLGEASFSLLSIYEESPYVEVGRDLEETLRLEPYRFFIAYPMSKSPEWYMMDFEERRRIMAEHIGMARAHPESKAIRSYTTYCPGLSDYEFVVIYETQSLASWSHVTGKLREARARRWVTSETPILVGVYSDLSFLGVGG